MKSRRKSPVTTITTEPQHCSIELRLKILGRLPFFAGLSGKALEAVNQRFVEIGYQPGDVVYAAGDPAERLYVMADGKVKLLQHGPSGRNVLLDILASGDFFGNLAIQDPATYTDTALAQTSACVLSIRSDEFRQVLNLHPELALNALSVIAERLSTANQRVLQLSAMPVDRRIAATLLRLGEKLGRDNEMGLLIDAPLSRDELAEMTGTTPETASRTIRQLQGSGLITSGRQWIAIANVEGLKALAEDGGNL